MQDPITVQHFSDLTITVGAAIFFTGHVCSLLVVWMNMKSRIRRLEDLAKANFEKFQELDDKQSQMEIRVAKIDSFLTGEYSHSGFKQQQQKRSSRKTSNQQRKEKSDDDD